ncbi:ubiquitin-like protein Pup [Actinomyces slackii]|uniref:Prokaryotic ubiquitin-like protein Pup n=1 Tax=Actinomyces slackii TaxID=52774 RepID=A0A3S4SKW9_9ACTO|nr:ubiquitin-like protein Pup [Actinomyces slackii]VEG75113.1 Bacterial ubiquitin-like modifier [Actinomyces slackii]
MAQTAGQGFAHPQDAGPQDTGPGALGGAGQAQVAGVDAILDEIDAVIETNAAAFVQGFVQKGGQ